MVDIIGSSGSALARLQQSQLTSADTTIRSAAAAVAAQSSQSAAVGQPGISESAKMELSSFVLQGFLKAALPKDLVGSEGVGTAGAMWRSMFAQELSKVIAQNADLNLLGDKTSAAPVTPDPRQWKTEIK
ncbi:MAG: hypothetical protein AAF346_12640 [Pseudomonadota bacterium]